MKGMLASLLMLCSVLALAAGYADTLASFHDRWGSTTQGYSHGYLLAAISAWLIWRRRASFYAPESRPQWLWLLPLAGGSLLWLAADTMQVRIIQQLLLPGLLWLWIAAVFGWRTARHHLFALLVLYLAIPVWDVLVLPLRELTVVVTQSVLAAGGIPAYIDGFRIYVPAGAFVVAGGCSGLNYLLVSLTLGTLYAHLYVGGWGRRTSVVALAVAVALVSNWVRVIALVLIGYFTEMRSELVADHETFGWVVFGLMLVPYVFVLRYFDLDAESVRRANSNFEASGERAVRQGAWERLWPAAWLATVIALSGPLLMLARDVLPEAEVPPVATPADAQVLEPPAWEPDWQGYDRAVHFQLAAAGRPVELSVYTWLEQSQGREMIYYRNRIAEEDLLLSGTATRRVNDLTVNETTVRDGTQRRLVWWYYRTAGEATADERVSKLLQLLGLVTGRASAELVVLSSRCEASDCEQARARLHGSGGRMLSQLEAGFRPSRTAAP